MAGDWVKYVTRLGATAVCMGMCCSESHFKLTPGGYYFPYTDRKF